jgi:hypothetical protein
VNEEAVKEDLVRLLQEMAGLRAFKAPPHEADPTVVHEALRDDLRLRLDRAEVLMAEASRYRRKARAEASRLGAEADDAYDEVLVGLSERARRAEFESIKDREVQARVKSSPKRRAARAAERFADQVDEAETVVRGMFFGLLNIRAELLVTLEHYFPWRSSLET